MEQRVRLLDCTLRDGGHLNNGNFGESVIKGVIRNLVQAKIDIIEVGFLCEQYCGPDVARFLTIEDVKRVLPEDMGESKVSLMADFVDLEHLEPCDGTVEFIRLSFKRHRLDWGLTTAKLLMEKGYKCFINPVNCNVYTDTQYLEVLHRVNELHPYGFSIVDTFGVMRKKDLSHRYYLAEYNLAQDIVIGVHFHENLGLAYSLAQHFMEIASPTRSVVVDGSLVGMGRVPGNLCIEQMMDHLNLQYGTHYNTEPAFDAIDEFIMPIKREIPWGYSIPYALSAKYSLHRTYAEYLMDKKRLRTKDIQRILSLVDPSEAELFNEAYVEGLYKDYMDVTYDSTADVAAIRKLLQGRKILVIAPGSSINQAKEAMALHQMEHNPVVIAVNFVPNFIQTDLVFCTNVRRYDRLVHRLTGEKLIVTSNVAADAQRKDYVLSYNDLVYFDEIYCDDSTLMLLNLLKQIGMKVVSLAGFDGAATGQLCFFDEQFASMHKKQSNTPKIQRILQTSFSEVELTFLTGSVYEH